MESAIWGDERSIPMWYRWTIDGCVVLCLNKRIMCLGLQTHFEYQTEWRISEGVDS